MENEEVKEWKCPGCDEVFPSKVDYVAHLEVSDC